MGKVIEIAIQKALLLKNVTISICVSRLHLTITSRSTEKGTKQRVLATLKLFCATDRSRLITCITGPEPGFREGVSFGRPRILNIKIPDGIKQQYRSEP